MSTLVTITYKGFRHALTCLCGSIHPRLVELASQTELTTSRTEALQARRSRASSHEIFAQPLLHGIRLYC